MMERIYLDWAATAPLSDRAREAYDKTAERFPGNPSAVHKEGKEASSLLEACRKRVAHMLGTEPEHIIFTSGGTESNAIVLHSFLRTKGTGKIIIPGFEHPAIWEYRLIFSEFGFSLAEPSIREESRFSVEEYVRLITGDTKLACCMAVHNETGEIFPIQKLVEAIRSKEEGHPVHIHTDAVQAGGKREISIAEDIIASGIDSASFSGHKIGAPRGIGILYLKKPLAHPFPGGGQEMGMRPGTENLPAIAALTESLTMATEGRLPSKEAQMLLFEELSSMKGVSVIPRSRKASPRNFVGSTISATASPIPSEALVRVMNDKGYAISAGSACSNRGSHGGKKIRRALMKAGVGEADALGAFRISIGPDTTCAQIEQFLQALDQTIQFLGRAF
jgi:cysteine desulfurase